MGPLCSGHISLGVLEARCLSCLNRIAHRELSFDLHAATQNYERRTEDAAQNRCGSSEGDVFRMVLPPPNVTGKLHLGHALTVTVEDALCRYKRIHGHKAVWHAGFDHAGIATQAVVEKDLWRESRLRRNQISREEFLQRCHRWKEQRVSEISGQLKRLGATLDWSDPYFTMDARFERAVRRAFCRLHSDGLIIREKRLVNWCPALCSTISDQEVDHVDVDNSKTLTVPSMEQNGERRVKFGIMYRIRYKLADENVGLDHLEVATTRPETVFADVALAVHPDDSRYSHLIGRRLIHPLLPDKTIPIIADKRVKQDKGTGVLKITPSHDFTDCEIAKDHEEEIGAEAMHRSCIDERARLINAPGFEGLDRFDARKKVLSHLKELGMCGGESVLDEAQVPVCSRTGDIIEPMVKEQWFLKCDQMNDRVLEAIDRGQVRITPSFLRTKLEEWLSNKEPWCLSRQLLWGHRIPAYRLPNSNDWVTAESREAALQALGVVEGIVQDEDVLDTWFSSSLVPIVVNGWPDKSIESNALSVMETGHDIIGFWVARMLTVCQRLTGHLPFKSVLLHGLVRDSAGRKMSKSLGNVIDPNDIIDGISLHQMITRIEHSALSDKEKSQFQVIDELACSNLRKTFPEGIRECGSDALRFALLRHDVTALDISLNILDTANEGLRFCNKLHNLCVYAKEVWSKSTSKADTVASNHVADRWIRSSLGSALDTMRSRMEEGSVHLAFKAIHKFILADLCDVYLETTKKALWTDDKGRLNEIAVVLHDVIERTLIALSVFMPFVSEHLFEQVKSDAQPSIYQHQLSQSEFANHIDNELEKSVSVGLALVSTIRSLRQQFELPAKMQLNVAVNTDVDESLSDAEPIVSDLANVRITSYNKFDSQMPNATLPVPVSGHPVLLAVHLDGEYRQALRGRIAAQLAKAEHRKKQFEGKAEKYERLCSNESARQSVIDKNRRKAVQTRGVAMGMVEEIAKLKNLLERIG